MIEKILLQNWRNHKRLKIDVDPAITVIIGPSDSGKSNIVRALQWITHNRPTGKTFIRKGQTGCRVRLQIDGVRVARVRTKKQNCYTIGKKKYKAFSTKVPEPVETILNIGDANYQQQHDKAFWLSSSPGQVSKSLNNIVDLSLIDSSLAYLASLKRKTTTKVELIQERVDQAQEDKKQCAWSLKAKKQLRLYERLDKKASSLVVQIAACRDLKKRVSLLTSEKKVAQTNAETVRQLISMLQDDQDKLVLLQDAQDIHTCIQDLERKLLSLKKQKLATKVKKKKLMKGRCPICKKPFNQ